MIINQAIVFALGFMPKDIVRYFASRYISGDTLSDAVNLVKDLNSQGMMATMDVLGESITRLEDASLAINEYKNCLTAISEHKIDSNISLKPTQFGLSIDKEVAFNNIREIVVFAKKHDIFVRIDMEDTPYTTDTYKMYTRLREDFSNVGTVMQAYLRRSYQDAIHLLEGGKTNLRLCKGIYIEPRELAYRDKYLVNKNYSYLLETLLKQNAYVGIATHDEKLVWESMRLISKLGLPKEKYEFQMLLGVDKELRDIILRAGHRLRIYVPYGTQWYPYSMRRLKENPEVAMHITRNLFKPG